MGGMTKLTLSLLVLLMATGMWAKKRSGPEFIALPNAHSPELRAGIEASFEAKDLKEGTAWAGHGPDFFFAVEAPSMPMLMIDDAAGPPTTQLPGTQLWYSIAHIEPVSRLHEFHYLVGGTKFGGRLDLPAFGP